MRTAVEALEDMAKDQLLATYRREGVRLRRIAKGLLTALEAAEDLESWNGHKSLWWWAEVAQPAIAAAKEKP